MTIEPFKLTEKNRIALENLVPDIATLEKEINKAENAGIDVTELRSKLTKIRTIREGILREYS